MIGRAALHYARVRLGMESPQTQTTPAEREALTRRLANRKAIVEIGVFEGFTTRVLAAAADEDATIYGVDPFFKGRLGISWGRKIAEYHNRADIKRGKVKFIPCLSTEVGNRTPPQVDYVFIDADHSLDAITEDWAFWSERLAPGGIIALHDTAAGSGPEAREFGSHQYFRSHIRHDPRFELVEQQDTLSVLVKKS